MTNLKPIPFEGFEVASWSPGEAGENIPPTQVHLIIPLNALGITFAVRLKSRAACDRLIDALIEHRDFTFGGDHDLPTQ